MPRLAQTPPDEGTLLILEEVVSWSSFSRNTAADVKLLVYHFFIHLFISFFFSFFFTVNDNKHCHGRVGACLLSCAKKKLRIRA